MQHLDTYEVMKNKAGQWYKQKDLGAYIILEGKRKNIKMSIGFDKEYADEFPPLSNETGSVLKEEVIHDKLSRNESPKVVQHTSSNGLVEKMKSTFINAFIKEQNTEIENHSEQNIISRKSPESYEDTIQHVKHSNNPEDNGTYRINPNLCVDCKSGMSINPATTLGQIEMFAKDNTAVIIAWNVIAIAIAIFTSVFCFLCPSSKVWANDSWARARQYQIELTKLAMQVPSTLKKHRTAVTKTWTYPLIWIGRFFSCLGKCIGISLPVLPKEWANDSWARARKYQIEFTKLAMQVPSSLNKHRTAVTKAWTYPLNWIWSFFSCLGKCIGISLPVLPKCIYCIINCFKETNIEEYDKTFIKNETAITQSDEPLFEAKSDGPLIRAESNLAKYPERHHSEAYISKLCSDSKLRPKTQEQGYSVKRESHESHSII